MQKGRFPKLARVLAAALALTAGSGLATPAAAQYCADCIAIQAEAAVWPQSAQVAVVLSVDAERLRATEADAYLAAVQPDNRVRILRRIPAWPVKDVEGWRMQVEPSAQREVGEYRLYFVLAEPGSDPIDSNHWIAAGSADIALLPDGMRLPEQPVLPDNSGPLPQVVSHGGGEIGGQPVSNSLQALERSFAAGQRFFELDFSWTADRHLVLIHDWDQSYRRLFSASGIPTKGEFDALAMNFGLDQLNVDQLLAWMARHPQVRIVTDIKEDNVSGLFYLAARAGEAMGRFIPQIHSADEYARVKAMGFDHLILTLYRSGMGDAELLDFVAAHELLAVTMPLQRALRQDSARLLQEQGVFVYAHTVNQAAFFGLLRERGVSGIYSDRLRPAP